MVRECFNAMSARAEQSLVPPNVRLGVADWFSHAGALRLVPQFLPPGRFSIRARRVLSATLLLTDLGLQAFPAFSAIELGTAVLVPDSTPWRPISSGLQLLARSS